MTPYILVVAKWRDDVFAALFFDGLPSELRRHIRIAEFGREPLTAALAGARAVIVMRHGLFSFGHLSRSAGWASVPRYYFLDDNYMLLQEEPELYGPYWSAYSDDRVRRALKGFHGVLLGSAALRGYFEGRALHPRLIDYPPIVWPILRERTHGWTREPGEPFRIAFFGGEHRRDLFTTLVYPAAQRLAASHLVELVLVGIDPGSLPSRDGNANLRIVHLPYELRYGAALDMLARHNIDVLAHPTPPSRNNPYKNANVLINARTVGAVGVLSNLPPYDTLPTPPPALLCENDPQSWYDALARLIRDPQLCADTFDRADRFCQTEFSGRPNAEVIARMLAAHPAPDSVTRTTRAVLAGPALGFDRALVRAKALVR
jgi:hypothetical protein